MKLSDQQKLDILNEGYTVIPGLIDEDPIKRTRHAINHSIGEVGMKDEDLEAMRSRSYCDELINEPVITDLLNGSAALPVLESALGVGRVLPAEFGQVALQFPIEPGTDIAPPEGHIDGLGTGLNGMAKGTYLRGFTALAVIYLADVDGVDCGNFTVWPKSHLRLRSFFSDVGHEILTEGMPSIALPERPVQVEGKAGDVVITHYLTVHFAAANACPDIRYAAIFRVKHTDCEANGLDGYTDIWREWPGLQEVAERV